MTSEIQQLSLARQFIEDAERQLQRGDDYSNGQAVSLAQDAVELILRAATRHFGLSLKPKAALMEMIEALDKHAAAARQPATPHRTRIEDLNQARISFKHFGIAPILLDARRFVRYGVEFAETAVPQFFSLDWQSLSLADAIRDESIRVLVKAAESMFADENYRSALIEAADAVRTVESRLDRLMPRANWSGSADDNRGIAQYLNGLRLVSLAALVHFDVRSLLRFKDLGFHVTRSISGERSVVMTRALTATAEQAAFGVSFARDFALAVQARLD